MDDSTRQADPYVLVPASSLKKIGIAEKKEGKQENIRSSRSFLIPRDAGSLVIVHGNRPLPGSAKETLFAV